MSIEFGAAELAMIAAAYLIAAFVKGVTGLGFSSTCLPFLVYAVGLKVALPLVLVPSIASNLFVMRTAGHFQETVVRFWPLFVAAVPGIVVGLWLLDTIDGDHAAAVLGVVLIVYALFTLTRPERRVPTAWQRPLAAPVGLTTGLVNGLTGSQVMPVLPYLMALQLEPSRFVQAINCSFTLSSLVMAVGLAHLGVLTVGTTIVSVAGLLVVALGVRLGTAVRDRMNPSAFRLVVLWILMALGASLVFRASF